LHSVRIVATVLIYGLTIASVSVANRDRAGVADQNLDPSILGVL
jgi:hypothetical protein